MECAAGIKNTQKCFPDVPSDSVSFSLSELQMESIICMYVYEYADVHKGC